MSEYREHIHLVPEHLRDAMVLYIEKGYQPGHFLTAVLENDLMEAMGRADNMSRDGLYGICQFLYNYAPAPCHGSPELVKRWMESRRKSEGAA
jgi:hypothetical protein